RKRVVYNNKAHQKLSGIPRVRRSVKKIGRPPQSCTRTHNGVPSNRQDSSSVTHMNSSEDWPLLFQFLNIGISITGQSRPPCRTNLDQFIRMTTTLGKI